MSYSVDTEQPLDKVTAAAFHDAKEELYAQGIKTPTRPVSTLQLDLLRPIIDDVRRSLPGNLLSAFRCNLNDAEDITLGEMAEILVCYDHLIRHGDESASFKYDLDYQLQHETDRTVPRLNSLNYASTYLVDAFLRAVGLLETLHEHIRTMAKKHPQKGFPRKEDDSLRMVLYALQQVLEQEPEGKYLKVFEPNSTPTYVELSQLLRHFDTAQRAFWLKYRRYSARAGKVIWNLVTPQDDIPDKSNSKKPPRPTRKNNKTTTTGYTNINSQRIVEKVYVRGEGQRQKVYVMECLECGAKYGANSSGLSQRKCPAHAGGKPGIPT